MDDARPPDVVGHEGGGLGKKDRTSSSSVGREVLWRMSQPNLLDDSVGYAGRGSPATCGVVPWMGSKRISVSVVIPAKNEAQNLAFVLPRIGPSVDEVILVDGQSGDATIEEAKRLRPDIRIVEHEGAGKGAALRAGFAVARGDIIVMLDADGSTDPAEIPLFLGALIAGADFVKGTRFAQGAGTADMSWLRWLGNRLFVLIVRLLFGGRYSDLCYGYAAFWRRVLPRLDLDCNGFEVETMMNVRALRAGLRVVEVPSFEYRRRYGKGNLRAVPDGWRVLVTILHERARRRFAGGAHARVRDDPTVRWEARSDPRSRIRQPGLVRSTRRRAPAWPPDLEVRADLPGAPRQRI